MKVKYNYLTAVQRYGGYSCMDCCFVDLYGYCIRQRFIDLGPCISKTKYYERILKSDIFEL